MQRNLPRTVGLGWVVLLVAFGCTTTEQRAWRSLPPLPADRVIASGKESSIQAARSLYLNKCTRCHKFHDPAQYRDVEWDGWMTKMSRKAKLNPEQESALRQLLDLYRPGPTVSY